LYLPIILEKEIGSSPVVVELSIDIIVSTFDFKSLGVVDNGIAVLITFEIEISFIFVSGCQF
jgi:hypothetical protein